MKGRKHHIRGLLPPASARAAPTAMVVHHSSARRRKRNAGGIGGSLLGDKGPVVPILAGAGGAVVATLGAEKLGMNPAVAAWGTAAIGAATALGTHGLVRQVATGVGAAGVCLGAIQLLSNARFESAKKQQEQHKAQQHRQAEVDGYITRAELNDLLAKSAEQRKQEHCDLITALRDEIKGVVQEMRPAQPAPQQSMPRTSFYRGAAGDEYERNAYVEDDYMRNAYSEDFERNAVVEEYERNAYFEDDYLRNAYGDDFERNAYVDEDRNAYVDEERNAASDEERNAGDEERNAAEEYGPN